MNNQIKGLEVQKDAITPKKEISSTETRTELTTEESIVRLAFKEFVLEIDSLNVWDKEEELKKMQQRFT